MKLKKILLIVILAPVVIIVTAIALMLLYVHGPIPILRLTPYEIEQKRTVFPQWINNDEICYLELVLHRDKTVFEQGKFILFIKQPIMDMYIYREKVGQPETKRLIKHIARKSIEPNQQLEAPMLDVNLGFRVYDEGKKIFIYYNKLYVTFRNEYTYITLDTTGRNMKERIPSIASFDIFDISQNGEKLYGISREYSKRDYIYYIAEYSIRDRKIKKIVDVTEDKFEQSKRGWIRDLKLLSKDKLVFSYEKDINMPGDGMYAYLIDIYSENVEFIDEFSKIYYSDSAPDYRGYSFAPYRGYVFSKDKNYLIAGNVGIYEKKENGWVRIKDFYKEYPVISPDGRKIAFFDILVRKGELSSLYFAGRKLTIMNLEDLLKGKEQVNVK